jgi:hypothetical protein
MAQEKEEILIEIVVSNEAAAKTIFENQQSIERLKQTQIELTKARKAGTITEEEYSKKSTAVKVAIDTQKESIRQNEKELRNNIKTQKDNTDSLAAMRAQLSNNIKEFDNLSKAERESAKGQELQKSIADTVEQLNEAEQATGRFQRQIGNYPEGMSKAGAGMNQVTGFLGKMSDQVSVVSPKLGGMISSFGGFAAKASGVSESVADMSSNIAQSGEAMGSIEGFAGKASGSLTNLATTSGTAAKASTGAFGSIASGARALGTVFLTPPIIIIAAVVGAIVAAFMLLKKGFSLNDEASTKMSESFAILQPIFDAIGKAASFLAGAIAEVVHFMAEATAGAIDAIAGFFGIKTGMADAAKAAMELVRAQDDLEEAERNFSVNTAKRAVKRSELMAEVMDKEKNNAEQRIAFLKDASKLDEQDLIDKKKLADENLRIIETLAKNESDTSDETADKIAAAKVRSLNAEREYFDGKKEINKKLAAAENELAAEQQANYEKWKQIHDEKLSKEKAAIRQLEDLVIQQIKDDYQRQILAEETKTKRANEDLQLRLDTEKNLTAKAKQAISDTIIQNNNILNDKVNELTEKSLDANIKKEIDAKTKEYEAKLQLAEKGTQAELNLKIGKLTLQRDAELLNENLTNVQRLAIEDKFLKDSQALKDAATAEKYNKLQSDLEKEFQLKILNAQNNGLFEDEQALLELEKAKAYQLSVINMDAETKAALKLSQQDYAIMVAKANQDVINSEQQVINAQVMKLEAFTSTMRSIGTLLNSILSSMSDDSEQAAEFAKAIAIFNIGVSLAEGIAGVVKTASKSSVTIYDYLAAIAAGSASVISTISAARKAFEPMPKKPAFASGGLVSGPGSGTSDSIDAKLSNGESVLNANSTAMFSPLLSALNQAGGGVGFGQQQVSNQLAGEDMLARAFAKGAAMIPPNILTLKEFHAANDRYVSLKEL